MDLDYFVFDLVIFIIVNDYDNVGMVLDELKSDFSGGLCEGNIANISYYAINRPKNRGHFGNQLVLISTSTNHEFWRIDSSMC